MELRVITGHVTVDHDGLSCALFTNQEYRLVLLGNRLDQEVRPDVVDVGNKDGAIFGSDV